MVVREGTDAHLHLISHEDPAFREQLGDKQSALVGGQLLRVNNNALFSYSLYLFRGWERVGVRVFFFFSLAPNAHATQP